MYQSAPYLKKKVSHETVSISMVVFKASPHSILNMDVT